MAVDGVLEETVVEDVSIDDFTTGWIAGLAVLGVSSVRMERDRFYRAVIAAYDHFVELCRAWNLRPRFIVQQTDYYRDSPDFRHALQRAAARGLVSLDNPGLVNLRLKYSRDDAHYLFRYLTGGEELYVPVAETFGQAYAS